MSEQVLPRAAPERLQWVDALRGLAALAVVAQHYLWPSVPKLLSHFVDPGIFGVTAFFCISGFLIPYSALRRKATVETFAAGRFFRLYPAYWVSVVLGAFTLGATVKLTLVNLTMLQRFVGFPDIIGVYWTLQVEMIFYVLMALLIALRLAGSGRLSLGATMLFLALGLSLAFVRFSHGSKAPVAPVFGLTVIFCAKTYYHHVFDGFLRRRTLVTFALGWFALLCVGFSLAYARDWGFDENPWRFVLGYSAGIAGFLLLAQWRHPHPLALFIGKVSYPIYLVHVPIKALCDRYLGSLTPAGAGVIGLLVTLGAAVALHKLVEMPGMRLGKRVIESWKRPRLSASDAPAESRP